VWRDDSRPFASDPLPVEAVEDVVIGAGITGLVSALLLARAGRRVVVLDAAATLGAGTTGASSAKVSLLQGLRLTEIVERHGPEVASAYLDANREGQAWLRRFCTTHDVPFQVRHAFTFVSDPNAVTRVEREYEYERQLGLPSTWCASMDAPFPVQAAIGLADQFQLDPLDLLEKLVDRVRDHGGAVCLGRRVLEVGHSQPLQIHCATGESVTGGHVVVATGTPILDRGLQFAGLQARRSYEVTLSGAEAPAGMFLSVDDTVVSVRDIPDRDLLLVGGFGHATGRTSSEAAHLEQLRAWVRTHFPRARVEQSWSAQDYRSYDSLPDVRLLPFSSGRVHTVTGFDKWGFTNSVGAALAVAAGTLGTPPPWAEDAYAGRRARSLIDLGAFNGSVVAELARGVTRCLDHLDKTKPAEGEGVVGHLGCKAVGVSTVDGQTRPIRPICTHLGGILAWNDAEQSWDCPLHGSRFAPDGEIIEGPAVRPLHPADGVDEVDSDGNRT
jgi:glycine/D-amino acid oxidase-like deaminating enzyme/nitrite reductase/ring-hydroxylating ferredoxin subunit